MRFLITMIVIVSLSCAGSTGGTGYTILMSEDTTIFFEENIISTKGIKGVYNMVVPVRKFVFDGSKDGRFIGRLTDSLMVYDKYSSFNMKLHSKDTTYILMIHDRIEDENIIDVKGCIISEAAGEPLFLMGFDDEELSRWGIEPTNDVVTIIQKEHRGNGFYIERIDDRFWMHALVRKVKNGYGIKIGFCGNANVFDDSVMSKHFKWVKEKE